MPLEIVRRAGRPPIWAATMLLLMSHGALAAKAPRLTTDAERAAILKEHFREGPDIRAQCMECHAADLLVPAARESAPKTSPAVDVLHLETDGEEGALEFSHRRFDALRSEFLAGAEVTEACLSCHHEAAEQVMRSRHGKEGGDPSLVDCLVCHDTTGEYRPLLSTGAYPFFSSGGGMDDLTRFARRVGKPGRRNCGTCHFGGGEAERLRRVDMDGSLLAGSRDVDVHMDALGPDFSCTDCHTTRAHLMADVSSYAGSNPVLTACDPREQGAFRYCAACHTATPHDWATLNRHTARVECPACHVSGVPRLRLALGRWGRVNAFGEGAGEDGASLAHMISPARDAVPCGDCHGRGGPPADFGGLYVPGREAWALIDFLGVVFVLGSIAASGVHGTLRVFAERRRS